MVACLDEQSCVGDNALLHVTLFITTLLVRVLLIRWQQQGVVGGHRGGSCGILVVFLHKAALDAGALVSIDLAELISEGQSHGAGDMKKNRTSLAIA